MLRIVRTSLPKVVPMSTTTSFKMTTAELAKRNERESATGKKERGGLK